MPWPFLSGVLLLQAVHNIEMDLTQKTRQGRMLTFHQNLKTLRECIRGTGSHNRLRIPDRLKDMIKKLIRATLSQS